MALIPPFFVDCVVAIGTDDPDGNRTWIASGFLYGYHLGDKPDGKKEYGIYLVSNRHVFEDMAQVYLRLNPQANEPDREYTLTLLDNDGAPLWVPHPNPEIDVAVITINIGWLEEQAMQVAYFRSDLEANVEKLKDLGITEGDFVYVLGFPMGFVGDLRNTVIVRGGSIARIRDVLAGTSQEFLVDAFIFPGNSGGPVVSKPEALSIEGTKSQKTAFLIGIVKSYVPYRDVAISLQTKRPRVIFEENSGLAAVHSVDCIHEAIQEHLKKEEASKL